MLVAIDQIPLPDSVPGRLFATAIRDVGDDPDAALDSVGADRLFLGAPKTAGIDSVNVPDAPDASTGSSPQWKPRAELSVTSR